ncbi:AAA family ATPase [Catenulispora sp. MAP12-49]|uniref:AAA family ATPase n=1 Tax=Catenulispora sp. MAP12-49 TaxID=3156302 RepID=UPI00351706CA
MEIVGRTREQDHLSAFISADTGQALVLRGETGVGKSSLLDFAAGLAAAEGHLIVRATGVEAESGLPYAGVHQLVYPLLQEADGPAACSTSTPAPATTPSAIRSYAPAWCNWPRRTSAARPTNGSRASTATTSSAGRRTWPRPPSIRTTRWRPCWRPPRSPRPGAAAPWPR